VWWKAYLRELSHEQLGGDFFFGNITFGKIAHAYIGLRWSCRWLHWASLACLWGTLTRRKRRRALTTAPPSGYWAVITPTCRWVMLGLVGGEASMWVVVD
jgi:hypothetical protein